MLVDNEELFTKDTYENYIMDFKKRPTVVKALCLHIAREDSGHANGGIAAFLTESEGRSHR